MEKENKGGGSPVHSEAGGGEGETKTLSEGDFFALEIRFDF